MPTGSQRSISVSIMQMVLPLVYLGRSRSHCDVVTAVLNASIQSAQLRSSPGVRSGGQLDCGDSSPVHGRDAAHPFELMQRSREIITTGRPVCDDRPSGLDRNFVVLLAAPSTRRAQGA